MGAGAPSGSWLHLEAELAASVARTFEAFTDPDVLRQWWGPDGFTIPSLDLDPSVGGRYRFAMQPPEGDLFHLEGNFLEVAPPERLSFTFRWEEADPDDVETVVTVALIDLGNSTRLTVQQGAFATEARRELHEGGWSESLRKLENLLASA